MSRATLLQILAVALCVSAAFVSYKLLAKHLTGSSGSAWFEAGCTAGDEPGGANCAAVLASPYSYWPPKKEDEPPGTPHIPVAFLGLVYYSTLAVWLAGVGRPSRRRRWLHLLPLGLVAWGLAGSVRYTHIMYTVLDEWCAWCLLTHILNLSVAACVFLLWPRALKLAPTERTTDASPGKPESDVDRTGATSSAGVAHAGHAPHPSWTRVLGTFGVIAVVVYGNYGSIGGLAAARNNATLQRCLAAVTRIKADTSKLIANWKLAEKKDITVRPDDPVRTKAKPGQKTIEVVVFSDFECPSCRRFAHLLDDKIQPLFDGRLKIVFKHFPLDTQCNEHVGRTLHEHACASAYIAEAARLQGGSVAFWQAHDILFALPTSGREADRVSRKEPAKIAGELGLDPDRLLQDMRSADVKSRVREDIELARSCGVRGTPGVFVEGKGVDPLAVVETDFWEKLAGLFRENVTPGTRGRTDAP